MPAGDPLIAKAQTELGNQLLRGGKFAEAEPLLVDAKATLEAANDPAATSCTITLAALQMRSRKATELDPCRTMLDVALEKSRAKGAAGQPQTAEILVTLADLDRMPRSPSTPVNCRTRSGSIAQLSRRRWRVLRMPVSCRHRRLLSPARCCVHGWPARAEI